MSGAEQAKAKDDAAAIMRAKQAAGSFPWWCFYLMILI